MSTALSLTRRETPKSSYWDTISWAAFLFLALAIVEKRSIAKVYGENDASNPSVLVWLPNHPPTQVCAHGVLGPGHPMEKFSPSSTPTFRWASFSHRATGYSASHVLLLRLETRQQPWRAEQVPAVYLLRGDSGNEMEAVGPGLLIIALRTSWRFLLHLVFWHYYFMFDAFVKSVN